VLRDFPPANANARYELGVHTNPKLHRHLHHPAPEPATLAEDNKALAAKAKNALNPWHSARISPVFYHLPPRGGKS
jgi:anti-sigma factor RsiW